MKNSQEYKNLHKLADALHKDNVHLLMRMLKENGESKNTIL